MTDTERRVTRNRRQGERRKHHEKFHGPERRVLQGRRTQAERRNS